MNQSLGGVYAPIVTPFDGRDEVDLNYLERLLDHLQDGGADGAVVLGTTGEFASLTLEEKRLVIGHSVQHAGDLKVIAGVGGPCLRETVELARYAEKRGAASLLVVPPYYVSNPPLEGLLAYYRRVFESVGLPVFFYHIPKNTGVPIGPDLIEPLLAYDHCRGLKDSGGDVEHTRRLLRQFPRLCILCGSDSLVTQALAAGAAGGITAACNLVPSWLRELYDHWRKADQEGAEEVQTRLSALRRALEPHSPPVAVKTALTLLGFRSTAVRPPLVPVEAAEREAFLSKLRPFLSL